MRKTKETHTFDFDPLGLAIREAREKAQLTHNDLGDKVFYGERHIAVLLKILRVAPKFFSYSMIWLPCSIYKLINISIQAKKVTKSTARRQIETSLDLLSDNELKIIQGTIRRYLEQQGEQEVIRFLLSFFIASTLLFADLLPQVTK